MKQATENISRRTTRIKGLCHIPGGKIPFSFAQVESAEEIKDAVAESAKLVEYVNRGLRRDAKLATTSGLGSSADTESVFSNARVAIKNIHAAMQKKNPNATLTDAGNAYLGIPGMREGLEEIGVVWGDPTDDDNEESSEEDDD